MFVGSRSDEIRSAPPSRAAGVWLACSGWCERRCPIREWIVNLNRFFPMIQSHRFASLVHCSTRPTRVWIDIENINSATTFLYNCPSGKKNNNGSQSRRQHQKVSKSLKLVYFVNWLWWCVLTVISIVNHAMFFFFF